MNFWNAILAFEVDTLIVTENIYDLRKTISCLELEIKKVGVAFNPKKSSILIKNDQCEDMEPETTEHYESKTLNRSVAYPDNVT